MTPELAPAIAEINAILKKHDVVGIVIVANKDHCDYAMEIEADWSCCSLEGDVNREQEQGIRFRARRADFDSPEAMKDIVEATIGALVNMRQCLKTNVGNLTAVLRMVAGHVRFQDPNWGKAEDQNFRGN